MHLADQQTDRVIAVTGRPVCPSFISTEKAFSTTEKNRLRPSTPRHAALVIGFFFVTERIFHSEESAQSNLVFARPWDSNRWLWER